MQLRLWTGVVKSLTLTFTLTFGIVASISLLLVYCVPLLKTSKEGHIVYIIAALTNPNFQHFLLVFGCTYTFVTLAAIGSLWASVRNIRNDEYVDNFLAYPSRRQRKRNVSRRSGASKSKNEPAAPFVSGVASILDFGNTMAPYMPGLTPRQKDYLALKSDWAAVGDDLQAAINRIDKELAQDEREATVGNGGRFA